MKTLKKGDIGDDVKFLQSLLFLKEDGIFGSLTEEGVKDFQKKNGLKVDGIVGPVTWSYLTSSTLNDYLIKSTRPIKEIILHCSATPEGEDFTVNDIKKWHLNRGFNDIGYHYVVYRDGSVNKGRNINTNGAHTTNHNTNTIGICYIGGCPSRNTKDWDKKGKDTRTEEQKKSLLKLVSDLLKLYNLKPENVKGHYEYASKSCPSFNMDEFRDELKKF